MKYISKFIFLSVIFLGLILIFAHSNQIAYAWEPTESTTVTKVLAQQQSGSEWVYSLYNLFRGFVNIIAVIILMIFAFANILHINIETYSIKKILPQLIIAIIAANIALPVLALFSRVIDSLQELSIFKTIPFTYRYLIGAAQDMFMKQAPAAIAAEWNTWGIVKVIGGFLAALTTNALGLVFSIAFLIVGIFVIIALSLTLAFRPYIVYLAAAVSPVAIILSVLPQTQSWFKRWLGIIIPWMIMPLGVHFLLNIGNIISDATGTMMIAGSGGAIGYMIGFFMPALIKLGLLYLAVRFPFMIEKDISSVIGKIGNYAGKAGWVGVGWGAEASSKWLGRKLIRETDKGETTAMKALSGDRESITTVQETRLTKLKEIQKSAQEKIKANKQNDLTEEEQRYGSMNDTQLSREAYIYASGTDIGLSEDERKIREREIRKSLAADALKASRIPPEERTSEETKLANLHTDSDAMDREVAKRLQEFETLTVEERKAERAASFGGVYAGEWQSTEPSAKAAQFIRTWNPYGIMGTIRSRMEALEKERQKEYDKYSRISATIRGNLLDTKYHQGIVKEDLGELPTAEQMMDYCRGSMKKFYSNVRNHLERQGITGLSDEEVVRIGNRFLKRFRTDVKGTKDYVAHPYFWGLSNREAATVIEGDYNISRQMAIEMRRQDRGH